jgi:hypothetical protein
MMQGMLFTGIFCTVLLSCKRKPDQVSKEELNEYVRDKGNGLRKGTTKNGIELTASYRPRDLLIIQEWEHVNKKDSSTLQQLKQKYTGQDYFVLELSKDNKEVIRQLEEFAQYSDMVHVLSFEMSRFVNITTAKDTVELMDYVFEQNYGLGAANRLMFVFPSEKLKTADSYDLNINEFGLNTGNVQFHFRRKDIEHIPAIKF